jgi:hypothetical protein
MMDPDDTWRRKYVWLPAGRDGEVNVGRKKFLGIVIPAFFFDGWHGAKIIRQIFQYLTIYTGVHSGVEFNFWLGIVLFGISNYITHTHLAYGGIFLKKRWE